LPVVVRCACVAKPFYWAPFVLFGAADPVR